MALVASQGVASPYMESAILRRRAYAGIEVNAL